MGKILYQQNQKNRKAGQSSMAIKELLRQGLSSNTSDPLQLYSAGSCVGKAEAYLVKCVSGLRFVALCCFICLLLTTAVLPYNELFSSSRIANPKGSKVMSQAPKMIR